MKSFYDTFIAGKTVLEAIVTAAAIGVSVGLLIGLPLAIIVYLLRLACS